MNDAFRVSGVERVGELDAEIDGVVDRQRLAGDRVAEQIAVEQLHDDELLSVVVGDFIDGADIRVAEAGRDARLVLKTKNSRVVRRALRRQQLDRHCASQRQIFSLVDDPDRTLAQFLENAVVGNGGANHLFTYRPLEAVPFSPYEGKPEQLFS